MPKNLQSILISMDAVPSLPEVAALTLRMLNDEEATPQEITNVVVKDSGLSSQILKLVNSAYFGLQNRISDLSYAISMLGFRRVKGVVISLLVLNSFRRLARQRREHFVRYWKHSAVSAGLCKRIASRTLKLDPESAFVIGLLHDVGKLVLMQYAFQEYDRICTQAKARAQAFHEAEREHLDTTHAEVGAWLAEHWNFAPTVVEGIRGHHDQEECRQAPSCAVCSLANYICWSKGITSAGSHEAQALDSSAYELLGLGVDDFDRLVSAAQEELELAEIILEVASH